MRDAADGAGLDAVVSGETRPGVLGSHVAPPALRRDPALDPDLGHDERDEVLFLELRFDAPRAPLSLRVFARLVLGFAFDFRATAGR